MKKIISVVLCLALLLTLSVSAFAAEASPGSDVKHDVQVKKGTVVTQENNNVKVKPNPSEGKFDNWDIYKPDGTPAEEGKDFVFKNGTNRNSEEMEVELLGDVIICANYNGEKTDPGTSTKDDKSPQTSDMSVAFVVVMLAAAAVAFGAKKVYSK